MRRRPTSIRVLRVAAGIPLKEISRRTSIGMPRLGRIERGLIVPRREEASKILDALSAEGVEVGALEEARRFLRKIGPIDGAEPPNPEAA